MWLYKRWQPLYDVIQTTVNPRVEFFQGIPLDLDQDSFIDPRTRNLIILDDLMSTASKDPRINELFTEGSHHRNLSVIALNQNLYYNKDPTQRRNCHYLVMFNNPVDKQQVMTLARQMYPENPQHLMRHFFEATSKPYGYLVVDLKPTTPNALRLRTDVLKFIREVTTQSMIHSQDDRKQTEPKTFVQDIYPDQQTRQQSKVEDMSSCDDCGLLFDNTHDLQRHIKAWCPELKRKRDNDDDEPPNKKWITALDSNEELAAFCNLMKNVKTINEDKWREKCEKYKKEGMDQKESVTKANEKIKPTDRLEFKRNYAILVTYILQLQNGHIHHKIMDYAKKMLTEEYNAQQSAMMAVNKYGYLVDAILDQEEEVDKGSDESDISDYDDDDNDDDDDDA